MVLFKQPFESMIRAGEKRGLMTDGRAKKEG
jgi:hypothetical protein